MFRGHSEAGAQHQRALMVLEAVAESLQWDQVLSGGHDVGVSSFFKAELVVYRCPSEYLELIGNGVKWFLSFELCISSPLCGKVLPTARRDYCMH